MAQFLQKINVFFFAKSSSPKNSDISVRAKSVSQFFVSLKINLYFQTFEPFIENLAQMESPTDPICQLSPDMSTKPDLSTLFREMKN